MGKACRSNGKSSPIDDIKESKSFRERAKLNDLKSTGISQNLETEENMAESKPELGIYDTRLFDADYRKWLFENGP